jgi:hypothetical protein
VITKIHQESRGAYGAQWVRRKLNQLGQWYNKKWITQIISRQGLFGTAKKKFKIHTTDSNHDRPIVGRVFKIESVKAQITKPN